jgi:hypothetical protein
MARKQGGSIYVSTDPSVTLAIGIAGQSTTIGRLGPTIYKGTNQVQVQDLLTEDGFNFLQTEDGLYDLVTESPYSITLSGSFPVGESGVPYVDGGGLTITGGTAPYTILQATNLPAGLVASIGSLRLTGTTTDTGFKGMTFQVADVNGVPSTPYSVVINIKSAVSMSGTAPATASVGTVYAYHPTTSNGVSPFVYAVTAGAIPSGTTLNTATGFVDGTLTTPQTATFTIGVTDALGATANTGSQTSVIT